MTTTWRSSCLPAQRIVAAPWSAGRVRSRHQSEQTAGRSERPGPQVSAEAIEADAVTTEQSQSLGLLFKEKIRNSRSARAVTVTAPDPRQHNALPGSAHTEPTAKKVDHRCAMDSDRCKDGDGVQHGVHFCHRRNRQALMVCLVRDTTVLDHLAWRLLVASVVVCIRSRLSPRPCGVVAIFTGSCWGTVG